MDKFNELSNLLDQINEKVSESIRKQKEIEDAKLEKNNNFMKVYEDIINPKMMEIKSMFVNKCHYIDGPELIDMYNFPYVVYKIKINDTQPFDFDIKFRPSGIFDRETKTSMSGILIEFSEPNNKENARENRINIQKFKKEDIDDLLLEWLTNRIK